MSIKTFIRLSFCSGLLACFIPQCTGNAADRSVDDVTDALAQNIVRHIGDDGENIQVDSFAGPSNTGENLSIEKSLATNLQKRGLKVVAPGLGPGRWRVDGSYTSVGVQGANGKRTEVQITARLYDEKNRPQKEFPAAPFPMNISTDDGVVESISPSFDASTSESIKDVSGAISNGVETPEITVAPDGKISATADSKFSIELFVANSASLTPTTADFTPLLGRVERLEFNTKNGLESHAKADLKPGEFYAIKINNDADFDIGVKVLIDGLSSFEFTEVAAYRQKDMWMVPRRDSAQNTGGSGFVYGWHRTNEYSDLFEVAHLPETVVGIRGSSVAKIGTIQVIVFPAWREGEKPPMGELASRGVSSNLIGTKQGAQIQNKLENVRRFVGSTPISSIVIKYTKPVDDLPPGLN